MEMVTDQLKQHESTGVALPDAGKLSAEHFMKFVDETRAQPAFRTAMDKAADYYDGNQLTSEQLNDLEMMGFGSLMTNLIKPAIDTVLGIEAKTRADFRMVSDDDAHQEVAEALSQRLKEVERETRADRACSDAYGSQVKTGLGWAHVTRNSDPFRYPYKVENVHRREMFWDWSSKDPALEDARYTIRQKWYPVDQVTAAMPEHAPLINASASGWQPDWMQRARENTVLMNAYDQESRISTSAWEWRNIDNHRIALQECWYATYVRGLVLRLGERTVEFDKRNQLHMAAVATGMVRPEPAVYRKLRCSMWFGPHLLQDVDPGANKLPYVPFWGFREDLTGVPYGLVRSMIPLQDEVNARRRKLMWLLSSKRVTIDSDALDQRFNTFAELVDEISRPDSMTVMNPSRTNKDAMRVESDLGLSQQQFEILTEAKEGIQAAAGIFNSIMGKTDGAKSGLAINSLVEQSSNTLGEINDNFKFSRQLVGERLVDMIRADMSGKQVKVMTGPQEARRKSIFLNMPKTDEVTGVLYRENDTDRANVKVALEDVPSTPAYRAQQQMMISETLKSLPPELQAPLMPFFIEATDLPKRHEMSALLRKTLGQAGADGEPQDPQVLQLQQQLQALQQQSEQAMQHYEQAVQEQSSKAQELGIQVQSLQLELKNKAGELAVRQAEIQLKQAQDVAAAQAQSAKTQLEQQHLQLKSGEIDLERQRLAMEQERNNADHAHRSSELEHNQLMAAGGTKDPEDDGKELEQLTAMVEKIVAPLADKVDLLVDAVQQDAKEDKSESVKGAQAEQPSTPAQPMVLNINLGGEDGESTPGRKGQAKPAKKSIVFTYGKDGKLSGAQVGGRQVATVKRGPDGKMTGADLTSAEPGEANETE